MSVYKDHPDHQPQSLPRSKSPDDDEYEAEPSPEPWYSRRTWVNHPRLPVLYSPLYPQPSVLNILFSRWRSIHLNNRYWGTLAFNFGAFLLPAVYATLSKMWIAQIDSSLVATTDSYVYAGIVVEVFNEGLPRAAWSTIANYSTNSLRLRLSLVYTLIIFQAIIGFILSLIFIGAAPAFVGNFVPGPVQAISVRYVRILAFSSCFSSTVETAVSLGTRSLDKPDVPLAISSVKIVMQIFLDLALISTVHVRGVIPSITNQAIIRLVCDLTGSTVGLVYFLVLARRMKHANGDSATSRPSIASLKILAKPGIPTFIESAVRNAIYLYLVHNVVGMGSDYATAWGVFNTIRWGLIMVPVQALEATSNTFVGHRWGQYLAKTRQPSSETGQRSWNDVLFITTPALRSTFIALCVEVPICLVLSFAACRPFAFYLSGSETVAAITEHMWKTIDWCYIMYAVSTCLATILLATKTQWYLGQSLISNLFYCLPWAIVLSKININPGDAWTYHALIFGGSLVVTFCIILVVNTIWAFRLRAGKFRD